MKKAISKKKASTKNVVGGSGKVTKLGFWNYADYLVGSCKYLRTQNERLWEEVISLQTAVSTLQSATQEVQ